MMRKTEIVIKNLKNLISSKGYIYALCMIIFGKTRKDKGTFRLSYFNKWRR